MLPICYYRPTEFAYGNHKRLRPYILLLGETLSLTAGMS